MEHYRSASTDPSSLESTDQYWSPGLRYPPATSQDALGAARGQELELDNIPNDPSNPWSYTFEHRHPVFTNALHSPNKHSEGHDFFRPTGKINSHISGLASQGSAMQPQHTEQWRILQPEHSLGSLSSYKAVDNSAFGFRNIEDHSFAPLGFGLANDFSRSPSVELCEGIFAGPTGFPRHSSSAGLFNSDFDKTAGSRPQEKVASRGQESDVILFPLEWNIPSESSARTHRNASTISIPNSQPDSQEHDQMNVLPTPIPSEPLLEQSPEVFDHTAKWAPKSPSDVSSLDIARPASHITSGLSTQPLQPSHDLPQRSAGAAAFEIPIICRNCSTQNTPLWRRGVDGLPMCNACGLFLRLHGTNRPLSLKTDVIRKRNRTSNSRSLTSPRGASSRGSKRPGSKSRVLDSDSIASKGGPANKRRRSVRTPVDLDRPHDVHGYRPSDVPMPG